MFRECYFEYAGISSQPYNLVLCYISNNNTEFDSGGKFDVKTDTLPRSHETLLYGKDYSAQPLSFEVEIVNVDDNIPLEQMTEIKNWLYGQNGWKTLKLFDERQNYCLKCIFEPGEDIVDGSGYKGLRCTLRNVSPFWYGEEVSKTYTHAELKAVTRSACPYYWSGNRTRPFGVIELDLNDDNMLDIEYFPIVVAEDNRGAYKANSTETYTDDTEFVFCLSNCNATTVTAGATLDGVGWDIPDTSRTAFETKYLGSDVDTLPSTAYDKFSVSTKYGYIQSQEYPDTQFWYKQPKLPYLTLHKGVNILRILEPTLYSSLEIKYTPVYRVGAF